MQLASPRAPATGLSTAARIRWQTLAGGFAWNVEYLVVSCFVQLAKVLGRDEADTKFVTIAFSAGALAGALAITTWLGGRFRARAYAPLVCFMCSVALVAATVGPFATRCAALFVAGATAPPIVNIIQAAIRTQLERGEHRPADSIARTLWWFMFGCLLCVTLLTFVNKALLTQQLTLPFLITAGLVACAGIILRFTLWDTKPEPMGLGALWQAILAPIVFLGVVVQLACGLVLKALDAVQQSLFTAEAPPEWVHVMARLWPVRTFVDAKGLYAALPTVTVALGALLAAALGALIAGWFLRILNGLLLSTGAWVMLLLADIWLRGTAVWAAAHLTAQGVLEAGTTVLTGAGQAVVLSRVPVALSNAAAAWMTIGKQLGGLAAGAAQAVVWVNRDSFPAMCRVALLVGLAAMLVMPWLKRVMTPLYERHELFRVAMAFTRLREVADRLLRPAEPEQHRVLSVSDDELVGPRGIGQLKDVGLSSSAVLVLELPCSVLIVVEAVSVGGKDGFAIWDSRRSNRVAPDGDQLIATIPEVVTYLLALVEREWEDGRLQLEELLVSRRKLIAGLRALAPRRPLLRVGRRHRYWQPLQRDTAWLVANAHRMAFMLRRLPGAGERTVGWAIVHKGKRPFLVWFDSARAFKPLKLDGGDASGELIKALRSLTRLPWLDGPRDDGPIAAAFASGPRRCHDALPGGHAPIPARRLDGDAPAELVAIARGAGWSVAPRDGHAQEDRAIAAGLSGLLLNHTTVVILARELAHVRFAGGHVWDVTTREAVALGTEVHYFAASTPARLRHHESMVSEAVAATPAIVTSAEPFARQVRNGGPHEPLLRGSAGAWSGWVRFPVPGGEHLQVTVQRGDGTQLQVRPWGEALAALRDPVSMTLMLAAVDRRRT